MSMSSTTLRCSEYSFRSHARCVEAMQGSNYQDSPVDAGPCARCRRVLAHEWEMKQRIQLNCPPKGFRQPLKYTDVFVSVQGCKGRSVEKVCVCRGGGVRLEL